MKRVRQELAFVIKVDTTKNGVSAGVESSEVRGDPIRRCLAVGVGGQDYSVGLAFAFEPSFGNVHRRATSCSRMCGLGRKSSFNDTDFE